MLVTLKHDHTLRTDDIIEGLRRTLARDLPGLKFTFQTGGIVSDVINFGLSAPIDIKISGPNLDTLAETTARIREIIADVPDAAAVRVHQGVSYPKPTST